MNRGILNVNGKVADETNAETFVDCGWLGSCPGKFIVLCKGDDYGDGWICGTAVRVGDDVKQDENNRKYVLCYPFIGYIEDGRLVSDEVGFPCEEDRYYL